MYEIGDGVTLHNNALVLWENIWTKGMKEQGVPSGLLIQYT